MLEAGQNIITRHLPKTGQTTNYFLDDDGQFEMGWWPGRLNANNRMRWIQRTIVADDIVVDRATGLMWSADCTAAGGNMGAPVGTWVLALLFANTLNFAGFTDWRLPNIYELHSILNFGAVPGWYQPPFTNVINNYYWSSTTYPVNIAFAMAIRWQNYATSTRDKLAAASVYVLAVRDAAI